ncbi:MAG: hypothetical protein FJW96_00970 [Actinobacteria bacterium]|nr:hypothetical protein [Actinomycetota bacterium]
MARIRLAVVVAALALLAGAASSGGAGAAGAAPTRFVDPERTYELMIESTWEPRHGVLKKGAELWIVDTDRSGFLANVNILTLKVPATITLRQYLDASVKSGPKALEGLKSIRATIQQGTRSRLAVWGYTSRQNGRRLRHVGVSAVRNGRAIVATFTATPRDFELLRKDVTQSLLTLYPY